jgi:hypothetical protein
MVMFLYNDAVGGQVQSVEVLPAMFNRTRNYISTRFHCTIADINQAWVGHPTVEILPLVNNAEPGSISSITHHLMLVSPRYAPIVVNRQLAPME